MGSMVVAVVEHEPGCPPARFGQWLVEAGATLDVRRPYAGDPLPTEFDRLVILGGAQNAHEDHRNDWFVPLRDLIRDCGVPVLGICLGHQLAAVAYGAASEPNPRGRSLGVIGIEWTDAAAADPLFAGFEGAGGIFWNNDVVVDLPEGTQVLARAGTGELQAARFSDHVWGVQWHPEVTEAAVRLWAIEDAGGGAVAAADEAALAGILAAEEDQQRTWRRLAQRFLDPALVGTHATPH